MSLRWLLLIGFVLAVAFVPISCGRTEIKVGSKKFTESVVLGEILAGLVREAGEPALHYAEMGGSSLLFSSLQTGGIDAYPEYTGTLRGELLARLDLQDDGQLRDALAERGVVLGPSIGFRNGYALAMKRERAEELGVRTIDDLRRRPDLKFGFNHEFLERDDGWPGLRQAYRLPQIGVAGMDHDVAYRQLDAGALDLVEAYETDADIKRLDLALLTDNRDYFPEYAAVVLYRADLAERSPAAVAAIERIGGLIDEPRMRTLNERATVDGLPEPQVASEFLRESLDVVQEVREPTLAERVWATTVDHLQLVRTSLGMAILFGVPLGLLAAKTGLFGQGILAGTGIVQTIPSLALLVLLIYPVNAVGLPSVGPGSYAAVVALFLYSLLPIVRNTATGVAGVAGPLDESARALGLTAWDRLRLVELPLASPLILAGIKTAAVINVGFATLGGLIGAGGYGQPILTGIRRDDFGTIMEGAVPAAVLAILVQLLFELAERVLVPRGLRLKKSV